MVGSLRDEPVDRPPVSRETAFRGAVWDVRRDTFEMAGERLTREVVDHPGAVAVLALDEQERVVLIRQYRHPVAMLEWELPAGLLDVDGEDPLAAARRELGEESDLVAGEWSLLVDYLSSPGGTSEALRVYLARGLGDVPVDERFEREGEEAHLEHARVPLEEVREAVLEGRVHNATLVVGVLAACALRDRGWEGLRPADAPWPSHPRRRPEGVGGPS